jgi:hypothetical protein
MHLLVTPQSHFHFCCLLIHLSFHIHLRSFVIADGATPAATTTPSSAATVAPVKKTFAAPTKVITIELVHDTLYSYYDDDRDITLV